MESKYADVETLETVIGELTSRDVGLVDAAMAD